MVAVFCYTLILYWFIIWLYFPFVCYKSSLCEQSIYLTIVRLIRSLKYSIQINLWFPSSFVFSLIFNFFTIACVPDPVPVQFGVTGDWRMVEIRRIFLSKRSSTSFFLSVEEVIFVTGDAYLRSLVSIVNHFWDPYKNRF